jgi:DNA-binding response OmpR family regulator
MDPAIQFDGARDAEELQSLLRHKVPCLIFLNLHLPGKDGLQCLQEIRSNPRLQNTLVVMLGPVKQPAQEKTAYHLGADLFFVKPFSYTDLKSGLKEILSFNRKVSEKADCPGTAIDNRSCPLEHLTISGKILFQPDRADKNGKSRND